MGDNVNTDVLHPPAYFDLRDHRVKDGFLKNIDSPSRRHFSLGGAGIIVAGKNFGCGSSRETTARSFKLNGIKAVVAESFSRIFYRNLVNIGLLALESPRVCDKFNNGDIMVIDLEINEIRNEEKKIRLKFSRIDDHIAKIIRSGGLIGYLTETKDSNFHL